MKHQTQIAIMNCYHYKQFFLDWFNHFLTIECFAEHYNFPIHPAKTIINQGRVLHQDQFGSSLGVHTEYFHHNTPNLPRYVYQ